MTTPQPLTVAAADAALAWAGADLDKIRTRWADDGKHHKTLTLCGEHHIPAGAEHQVLELLRGARADVHHLLAILDAIAGSGHP